MKKTAKLIALAAVLFAGFGPGNANAEGFKIGADVVSSYVWRGSELDNSVNVQPALSYTFKNGLAISAWGSYGLSEDNGERYKEVDLTVSMPVGPVTLAVTDYNNDPGNDNPDNGGLFDFREDGANTVEVSASYSKDNVGLMAGVFVAGNDYKNAVYCEASYQFYNKDGYTAKAVAGVGSEDYYGDFEGDGSDKFALVNTGISVAKDRFTASAIYNPDKEASSLVFMASF
ncbi:MAG: hypothetical protein HGB16_02190 [Chlorobaculum sp.]|nr:hypothetical protein [Chlorobaculum sp.]